MLSTLCIIWIIQRHPTFSLPRGMTEMTVAEWLWLPTEENRIRVCGCWTFLLLFLLSPRLLSKNPHSPQSLLEIGFVWWTEIQSHQRTIKRPVLLALSNNCTRWQKKVCTAAGTETCWGVVKSWCEYVTAKELTFLQHARWEVGSDPWGFSEHFHLLVWIIHETLP